MKGLQRAVKVAPHYRPPWEPPWHGPAATVIAILAAIHALGGIHLDIVAANGIHVVMTMF